MNKIENMNLKVQLYDISTKNAIQSIVDEIAERLNTSKKEARLLVNNSLMYNLVTETITEQILWMTGNDEDKWQGGGIMSLIAVLLALDTALMFIADYVGENK